MTELEKAVANALRLSEPAAEKLLDTIQRNIAAARMELIRSGVSEEVVNASNELVEDAIITFCLIRMGDVDDRQYYETSFVFQEDNLRKS